MSPPPRAITGTITSVTISGPPVVKVNGWPMRTARRCRACPRPTWAGRIAQLVPGQNGMSSQWNSYIYTTVTPVGLPDRCGCL
jgi:hypothetical protein